MDQPNSVVCICETNEQAQRAMYNLQGAGVDMGILSIATKDVSFEPHAADYYHVGDETFLIPGIGYLLINGPLAGWIVAAFDNGAGGGRFSMVGAALATLGIAYPSLLQYKAALKTDKYLVVVHGSPDAVAAA